MTEWLFDDAPNVASFTVRSVMSGEAPIRLVSHDADDGSWQFLPGTEVLPEDAVVVALHRVVELDPTVAELADLPRGFHAERAERGSPWRRERS